MNLPPGRLLLNIIDVCVCSLLHFEITLFGTVNKFGKHHWIQQFKQRSSDRQTDAVLNQHLKLGSESILSKKTLSTVQFTNT